MIDKKRLDALLLGVDRVPAEYFTAYPGGWKGEISTSLIDAVFSIRARYRAKDPRFGVLGRVRSFREMYPSALYSLEELCSVGSGQIKEVMGRSTVYGSRAKSEAVIDVAQRFIEADIVHAHDFLAADPHAMKKIYTSVQGLGVKTLEYFSMLLGLPGVKADTMITRFVNNALAAKDLSSASPETVRKLIIEAHHATKKGETLTHFDHALWKFQSDYRI